MDQTLNRNDLVTRMNLSGVPTDVQDQIIAQFGENVVKSTTLKVISLLSPEDQTTFEELLKKNNQDELENFLNEKVPSFNQILKDTADSQIEAVRKAMTE